MTMTNPITIDTTQREHEQREAFQGALSQMGITLPSKSFDRAFARIREIALQILVSKLKAKPSR